MTKADASASAFLCLLLFHGIFIKGKTLLIFLLKNYSADFPRFLSPLISNCLIHKLSMIFEYLY